MFKTALGHERELGLDFWADETPDVDGGSFVILPSAEANGGPPPIKWAARLEEPAKSVDQRVKMPRFIDEFRRRGGEFVVKAASVDDLETYTADSDLTIVAAGKGEIAKLFARDDQRSAFSEPQRALALTYVHGMDPRPDFSAVGFNIISGVGEYFSFPALTLSGACDIMVFEGIPGGPMDRWSPGMSAAEHLEVSLDVLRRYLPWEAERNKNVALTDDLGVLSGRFPPTVRHPVATLGSGRQVLGMADVVVLNDPLTGQGSNNASKCAASYLTSIIEHGDRPFDETFKHETFERYWEEAQFVSAFTNAFLLPPPMHVIEMLGAAQEYHQIAERFVNDFDQPRRLFNWFMDPDLARKHLVEIKAGA
jgi:hypothetical protein